MKAIETQYKGYRFRSRLEARWAVFFDALGIRWEYEPEGFELGFGERYLPDFRIHGNTWVEVKPAGHKSIAVPAIYIAGKMDKLHKGETDWRHDAMGDHGVSIEIADHFLAENAYGVVAIDRAFGEVPSLVGSISRQWFRYVGPFRQSGAAHGWETHGVDVGWSASDQVFSHALRGIQSADIVFAVLDSDDAFGTIAEVGYARALNKHIVGVFSRSNSVEVVDDEGVSDGAPLNKELWFVQRMCDLVHVVDEPRAKLARVISEYLRARGQPTKEEIFIAQHGGVIVRGDPVDNVHVMRTLPGYLAPRFASAADKARGARFEFGESGAAE